MLSHSCGSCFAWFLRMVKKAGSMQFMLNLKTESYLKARVKDWCFWGCKAARDCLANNSLASSQGIPDQIGCNTAHDMYHIQWYIDQLCQFEGSVCCLVLKGWIGFRLTAGSNVVGENRQDAHSSGLSEYSFLHEASLSGDPCEPTNSHSSRSCCWSRPCS